MSHAEEPDYTVVASKGSIELRHYSPMIIAEVEVPGERKDAIRKGFTILANYIFGGNSADTKMSMTAPVMQQKDLNGWKIRFILPKAYTLENLPTPISKEVVLIQIPSTVLAVIRFSGFAGEKSINTNTQKLEAYISRENLDTLGEPILAFYNPPWTLPFLRRNEVMIKTRNAP